jgi:parallel beta-helix repeat protein
VDGVASGNATVGAIQGTGNTVIYTAPAATGSHVITATSVADTTRTASSTVTVAATTATVANTGMVVNVRNAPYSALGDGVTDDTAAIQSAVNAVAGTGGEVLIPAGTYLINPIANSGAGINLGSNMTLSLATGAVLQARSTATSNYKVVLASGVTHVNITGGTIIGNRNNNTITDTAEAGMGITVASSSNVVIEGVTVTDCWADGIYISGGTNVTLNQVVSNNSRRNGLSIVNGSILVVRGSTFENATGSLEGGVLANGGGIDVEPNIGNTVSTLLISHCTFTGNVALAIGSGVGIANTGLAFTRTVFIDGNTVTNNLSRGIDIANCSGTSVTRNMVSGNVGYGILFRAGADNGFCTGNTVTGTTGTPGNGITEDTCSGNTITGNTCSGNAGRGVYAVASTGDTVGANTQSGNGISP